MLSHLPDRRVTAYDDDLEDIPSSGQLPMYLGGVALPLILIGYGVWSFATGRGVLAGESAPLDLYGAQAVALGMASLSLGIFLHCHYFWGNLYHLAAFAVAGKILSALGFIGSLGYLIVRIGVLGK